ncbi:hypothetical protein F503_00384 [Ophiostoma piceae UAMH 11346]|uniref:BTB domain-containing protein n=1 Tax=Ophiostoma piceae (strain UAMH 11346) TaxID=1262450 RepID=S3C4D3_OPHP1|nr:hypothetical protein F503_00384 [Ophiostoma piceae UAMH 11346]
MAVQRKVIDPRGDIVISLRRETAHERKRRKKVASRQSAFGDAQDRSQNLGPATEPFELVVSSKVLCLISPVFEALLTGPFRESEEFANASNRGRRETNRPSAVGSIIGGPTASNGASDESIEASDESSAGTTDSLYTLDLPEDDPEAMTTLLNIAHFRPASGLPGGLAKKDSTDDCGTVVLEKVAVLCDKYQCLSILGVVGQHWAQIAYDKLRAKYLDPYLQEAKEKGHGRQDPRLDAYVINCSRLLVFCVVADLPDTFAALCSDVVDHHVGPITTLVSQSEQATGMKRLMDDTTPANMLQHALLPRTLAGMIYTPEGLCVPVPSFRELSY